jgi:phosphocarrier protein
MTFDTCSRSLTIPEGEGLHLRAAAALANVAKEFQSDISASINGRKVDAKSIIDLLTMAAEPNAAITLEAKGPDSSLAVSAIADLVLSDFRKSSERRYG